MKAAEARVFWRAAHLINPNAGGFSSRRIYDVRVIGPTDETPSDDTHPQSHGACVNLWMGGDPYYTPEGLFANLAAQGFGSRVELMNAAAEFGKIDECDWARRMAMSLQAQALREEWE